MYAPSSRGRRARRLSCPTQCKTPGREMEFPSRERTWEAANPGIIYRNLALNVEPDGKFVDIDGRRWMIQREVQDSGNVTKSRDLRDSRDIRDAKKPFSSCL